MIYFNQAAGGLAPESSIDAITAHLRQEMDQGAYNAALAAQPEAQKLYTLLASLLHCQPSEIALTTGNSHGWNAVITAMPWQAGDKILITRGEWGGNVAMLHQLQQRAGVELEEIPCDVHGTLDLEGLQRKLAAEPRIKLVALTWVPANGATIYPAAALGAICAQFGVAYVIDAAQALGHIPVDVQELQCDALTAPGRKWLCGPRGTGVLYVRSSFLPQLRPMVVDHRSCPITAQGPQLRTDTLVLEQSEHALALRLGLKAALEHAQHTGWATRHAAIAHNGQSLRSALQALPHVQLHDADAHAAHSGIASFTVQGCTAIEVQNHLTQQQISVAVHTLGFTPLDTQARGLGSVVRASVGWQTTPADIKALQTALSALDQPEVAAQY